uniref:Uncharacterized protein n=1 Tax=Medicago truncatula TaxID=3880 RepID=A2Q305_MEDTR|nr:hypothetical protein MtrDRAFT_AC154113g16v2 [Medicago truncatula]
MKMNVNHQLNSHDLTKENRQSLFRQWGRWWCLNIEQNYLIDTILHLLLVGGSCFVPVSERQSR